MNYLKPEWAYWIAEEYPNFIKSISECKMIDIDDIDLYNQRNRARVNPVNQRDVKIIADSFDDVGWLSNSEPAVLVKLKPTNAVTTSFLYEAVCCFHRLTAADESENLIQVPAHVIELQDKLSQSDVDFILSHIALEENGNKPHTIVSTENDVISGLLNMVKNYKVDGDDALPEEKVNYLHDYLKKCRRKNEETEGKRYPQWSRYDKIRDIISKIEIELGTKIPTVSFHNFGLAQNWLKRGYRRGMCPTLGNLKFDNINFKSPHTKIQKPIKGNDTYKSFVLYWPDNRKDRNIRDMFDVFNKIEDEKIDDVNILLFLSAKSDDVSKIDDVLLKYVKSVERDLERLDSKYKNFIKRVGIIPTDHRHEENEMINYHRYCLNNGIFI